MSKFLVVEPDREDESNFSNFAVIEAESEDGAESRYLEQVDVDLDEIDLIILDLDEVEPDYYHYLEVDVDKA